MARNNHVDAGGAAPDFKLPRDGGDFTQLSDYDGSFLVLYFYPKDDTARMHQTSHRILREKVGVFARRRQDFGRLKGHRGEARKVHRQA